MRIGMGLGVIARILRGSGLTFLLRDDFLTDEAAPLASPRTSEPGPGTLTITDTAGTRLLITGGKLSITGNGAWDEAGVHSSSFGRTAGRAFLADITPTLAALAGMVGFTAIASADFTGYNTVGLELTSAGELKARYTSGLASPSVYTLVSGSNYKIAIILRAIGRLLCVREAGIWRLTYVDSESSTATLHVGAAHRGGTVVYDTFRVLDLPAPFDTDYGLATDRKAGAVTAGTTFTHEANCVIEWTQTTLPSGGQETIRFRVQDSQNLWRVAIDSTGLFALVERVANSESTRASAAGVIASGHRIVIVCDGSTIRGYSNNVLRWTYSSASNFATATAGELNSLGTGGAVSDVVAWPRTLPMAAAALLDQAVAA